MAKNGEQLLLRRISKDERSKNVSFKNLDNKVLVIHPDEVDKEKSTIIGYINAGQKEYKGNQKYCIRLGLGDDETYFDVMRKAQGKVIGYLPVDAGENNVYVGVIKTPVVPIVIPLVCIACAIAIGATAVALNNNADMNSDSSSSNTDITIADGTPFDGTINDGHVETAEEAKYIEIPGYSNIYISKGSTVDLVNPEGNQVYFKYTITEGNKTIYESDYIKPGEKIAWNAADYISGVGEHDLIFAVSTVDVENGSACNGATFAVTATVS